MINDIISPIGVSILSQLQVYLNSKTYGCQEYFINAHIVETHFQLSTKRITSSTYLVAPINLFKYLKNCS
jgi:hypothetical protein